MHCPNCNKKIGGESHEGETRVRLGIVLISKSGAIHGPCPHCKADVTLAHTADLVKALQEPKPIERKRRRIVRPGLPVQG